MNSNIELSLTNTISLQRLAIIRTVLAMIMRVSASWPREFFLMRMVGYVQLGYIIKHIILVLHTHGRARAEPYTGSLGILLG